MAEVNPKILGLVALAVVTSITGSLYSSHESGQTNDRLCDYIQENAKVTKVRSAATLKRDAAVDTFLGSSAKLGAKGDKASPFTQLSRVYLKAAAEVAQERAENPLPEAPAECN